MQMYKIYVGDYVKSGTPNTWTITGQVPRNHLIEHVKELMKSTKQGMEIYIVTPEKEVHAVYREGLENKWK